MSNDESRMKNASRQRRHTTGSMKCWQIILAVAIFFEAIENILSQQVAPGTPPSAPPAAGPAYPVTTVPTTGAIQPPPYMQTAPVVIQSGPPVAPVVPAPGTAGTAVPLPSQTPGSIFGPPLVAPNSGVPNAAVVEPAPVSPLADIAPGGQVSPQFGLPSPETLAGPQNAIAVPVVNDDWAWDQIADVVSDYFTIAREQRARRGEIVCEGRIETAPQTGATWLEPNRHDSVGSFNRWESTFQTIRRRAVVRVIPDGAGYLVEVTVEKELEDLPRPERATAGAATFITEGTGTLPSRREQSALRTRSAPCWISLGRDPPLEQRMLAEIHARLAGVTTSTNPSPWQ
jgi:hypothetical protein